MFPATKLHLSMILPYFTIMSHIYRGAMGTSTLIHIFRICAQVPSGAPADKAQRHREMVAIFTPNV